MPAVLPLVALVAALVARLVAEAESSFSHATNSFGASSPAARGRVRTAGELLSFFRHLKAMAYCHHHSRVAQLDAVQMASWTREAQEWRGL